MENSTKAARVLMITPFAPPNIGGAETHLEDLYKYLTEKDYQVILLTYQPLTTKIRGLSYEENNHLKIYRFDLFGHNIFPRLEKYHPIFNFSYLTPLLFFQSFLFMFRHRREVDIIHVFGLSAAFIARFLKIFFKKPLVMSTETIYNFNTRSLFAFISRWVLTGFDAILAQSEASKRDIMKIGFPERKITVYNHWIDLTRFHPEDKEALKARLGWENKFTVLYVGRLLHQKGIEVFIEAARKCRENINFKVIGDEGPELEYVKQSCQFSKNLEFIGKVAYHDLPSYYAAANVLVYPALYSEDMARVIIESLACGTPVINSNQGSGIYELNDQVSFITAPEIEGILEKIYHLYNSPSVADSMSRASVVFAQKFGPILGSVITDTYGHILRKK